MKVVLFCGGMGMRLREYSEALPKPIVPIGSRPILWHLMKYYSHFGHRDFILCLGWQAAAIKDYFLNYNECASNDFVLSSGRKVSLLASDIQDWNITFVDTGLSASVGQRLTAVQQHLDGDDEFLANYADGLTDLCLPEMIDYFHDQNTVAACLNVKPRQSFHLVEAGPDGLATGIVPIGESPLWMNGGFFVFKSAIFDYLHAGEDLVGHAFPRLIAARQLSVFPYEGFWGCMDTYKEKQLLDDMHAKGETPWAVWKRPAPPVEIPILRAPQIAAG